MLPGFSHTTGRAIDRTRQYFPRAEDQAIFRAHCAEFAQMTRLAVATLWTPELADVASVALKTKRDYCRRWKLPYIERFGRLHKDRPAAWSKLPLLLSELPRFGWIFWSDADAMFANESIDLRDFLDEDADLIWTEDESGPNTGNFFVRHCPASIDLLQRADRLFGQTSQEDRRGRFRGQWEQAAIREVIESGNAPGLRVKVIAKRAINSYDTDYEPGDFILHLPGPLKMERLNRFLSAVSLQIPDPLSSPLPAPEISR